MLIVCPACRAPSNTQQVQCWVCKRVFDGSEPRIGAVPFTGRPAHIREFEYSSNVQRARPAAIARYR
jgi:hypothetical protein